MCKYVYRCVAVSICNTCNIQRNTVYLLHTKSNIYNGTGLLKYFQIMYSWLDRNSKPCLSAVNEV